MMDSVDRYVHLLSGLICSKVKDIAVVKKIRQMDSEKEAFKFFQRASYPPSVSRWVFYSENARRKAIRGIQSYLKDIGVKFPEPNESVQRFLDKGKRPKKKKR
ncbi:MAG: hypothetical protein ABIH10_00885 [Spirochaetota bacterium]